MKKQIKKNPGFTPIDQSEIDFFLWPVGTEIEVGNISHKDAIYLRKKANDLFVTISIAKWKLKKISQKYHIYIREGVPRAQNLYALVDKDRLYKPE